MMYLFRHFLYVLFASALLPQHLACVTSPAGTRDAAELRSDVEDVRAMVGPGDILEIRVFREKELSGTFEVNGDGEIRLPLLDALVVNNLTSAEITEKVEAAYNEKYLKNAQVTVFVKDYNSRKIIVVGEVKKPGPVAYRVRMTIVEAVARAGGTTRLAAPSKTIIIREKNGERVRFLVDLNEVKRGDSADIVLYPGDIISVPVSPF